MLYFLCRLEAGNNLAFLVDQEFGEVPLDVRLLLVVWVSLRQHILQDVGDGVLHVPAGKALLLLQELEQRVGIVAVDLYLLEAGKLCTEVQLAELVYALVSAGRGSQGVRNPGCDSHGRAFPTPHTGG